MIPEKVTESREHSGRPILVYALAFVLVHVVTSSTGLLSPELGQVRVLTVILFGALLCAMAMAFERRLTGENRVLREARDAAVAEAERAQLLTELEATQRLESLGVLAGGIAHDFNNVLQTIMGNADFLSAELEEGSPAIKHVDGIEKATGRAAELVRQILTYAGRGSMPGAPVDLNEVVADIHQLVPLPLRTGVDIRVQLAEQPLRVEGDPTRLRQVALNLVINACEAVDETGVVTISTRQDVMPPLPGMRAILEVQDTGTGMDIATRTRIFEPYFTTKSAGRGLGLATSWGIVSSHAGVIDVESQPGRGTRITVAFPLTDAAASQPSAARREDNGTATAETVLVVDDEPGVASLLQNALQGRGHSVVTAGDGPAGLRILAERADVGLTFLDLTMPGMEAPEVMREMRELRPDLPIIVMTGYDRHTAIPQLRQYQPEAFLYKPFRLAELFSVTERVLRGKGEEEEEATPPRLES